MVTRDKGQERHKKQKVCLHKGNRRNLMVRDTFYILTINANTLLCYYITVL